MFSSLPHIHWCVAFCAVKTDLHRDCDTPLDGPPSVDSTSSSRHRFIARYRPTIVLIAAGSRSVHSMRWNQMLAQNRDFCLPHLHSMSPLGGGVPVGILPWCFLWKTRMVWLPDGELLRSTASFKSKLKSFMFHAADTGNTMWTLEYVIGLLVGGALQVTVACCCLLLLKKIRRYLYSFWQNVRTWQAGRRTPHYGIGRAFA